MQFKCVRYMLACVVMVSSPKTPDTGRILVSGSEAQLTVDSPRPVDTAAQLLFQHYRAIINVEDPLYVNMLEIVDVTEEVARSPQPGHRVLVPRGGRLEIKFTVDKSGKPTNMEQVLRTLLQTANSQWPYGYKLLVMGDKYTIVSTSTRDLTGHVRKAPPLLDRQVTILRGKRTIAEHARIAMQDLASQTGFRVSCCQAAIAGIAWGLEVVDFQASGETARSVLTRLIDKVPGRSRYYQRCDPVVRGRPTWCVITVDSTTFEQQ